MKVSYITMRFPAPSETFACTDVRALQQAGVHVSVHALRKPSVDPGVLLAERRLTSLDVTHGGVFAFIRGLIECLKRPGLTLRVSVWLVMATLARPKQLAAALCLVPRAMGIIAALEREQPDVVHLFWGHYPCVVGFLVLRRLPRAVLSVFLGAYDLSRPFSAASWVVRRAAVIWTHAQSNLPLIEAMGVPRGRIHVAYRGIDSTCFNGADADKVPRRIVAVGRHEAEKGIYEALQVFKTVHSRWPDSTLHLVGDGPERKTLERLCQTLHIASSVTFLGHVKQTEVARELSAAEILLHMSWEETLPNVVKEAMASNCVCIVTKTFGIEELVEDGRSGFIVSPTDVDAAARRIEDVFTGRVDVAAMTTAASNHIATLFDVSRSMQSYIQRWQDALSRRQAHVGNREPGAILPTSV